MWLAIAGWLDRPLFGNCNDKVIQISLPARIKELDLTDQVAVQTFFEAEKPEYVFWSAAKVGGIVANSEALADFMYDNMMLEMNVIHSAWKNGCKKLEFPWVRRAFIQNLRRSLCRKAAF